MSLKRKSLPSTPKRKALPATPNKRKKLSDDAMRSLLGTPHNTLDGTNYKRDEFIRASGLLTAPLPEQDMEFSQYTSGRAKQKLMWNILKEKTSISSHSELATAVEAASKKNASKSPARTRRASLGVTSSSSVGDDDWQLYQQSASRLFGGTQFSPALHAGDEAEVDEGKNESEVRRPSSVLPPSSVPVAATNENGLNKKQLLQLVPVILLFSTIVCLPNLLDASYQTRVYLLIGLVAAAVGGLLAKGRWAQDSAFHNFVDKRTMHCCSVYCNNSNDVLSNFGFFVVGAIGMDTMWRGSASVYGLAPTLVATDNEVEWWAWFSLFAGTFLIGAGSSYYHWCPNNKTLVWDRLPMTVVFMAALAVALHEYLKCRFYLTELMVLGMSSVAYWAAFDDLRPYALTQGVSCMAIPVMMINFSPTCSRQIDLFTCLVFYALAKIAEQLDQEIYGATGFIISGHSLKHLLSTAGLAALLYYVTHREVILA